MNEDDIEATPCVVSTTRYAEDGTGVNRLWFVDESTFEAIIAFLPDEADETTLFTPSDVEAAAELLSGLPTVYRGSDVDATD